RSTRSCRWTFSRTSDRRTLASSTTPSTPRSGSSCGSSGDTPGAGPSCGCLAWTERRPYLLRIPFVPPRTPTSVAYPYVVRLIIDDAIPGEQIQRLNQLCLVIVGILLLEAGATWGRDYFFAWGAERVGVHVRRLVFETLLRQDIQFFDSRDTGEITTRLWADVPPLEHALGEELADTLKNAVFVVCGTALLFYTSPRLTLFMLLGLPPILFASSVLGRRVKARAADVQHAHG